MKNEIPQHKHADFLSTLRAAGFVTLHGSGKILAIDKPRVCAFLYCSLRTLERWLASNKPCPRALSLLHNKGRTLPACFGAFSFTRDDLLYCDLWRVGIDPQELGQFHTHRAGANRSLNDLNVKGRYIDTLRDKHAHNHHVQGLKDISAQLNALATSPLFHLDDHD